MIKTMILGGLFIISTLVLFVVNPAKLKRHSSCWGNILYGLYVLNDVMLVLLLVCWVIPTSWHVCTLMVNRHW